MIENARKRVKMFSQFFDDQDISEYVNFRDLFRLLYLLNNGGNVFKILLILLIKQQSCLKVGNIGFYIH
jgi:hypothetical protein